MGGMGRFRRVAGGTAVAALLMVSGACYPGTINDIGEADLVITARDTTFTFAAGTYAMPDSIVRFGDGDEDDIDRSFDAQILAAIASEFAALGYTRIDESSPTAPDVVVFVGANSSTYNVWYPGGGWGGWWGWWGWYPGWGGWYPGWGPGYGPGYPWYPPVYAGSYSTGSLFIGMIDPAPSVGPELNGVWGAVINGLLSSSNANTAARAVDLIEQAFEQSPYLDGN